MDEVLIGESAENCIGAYYEIDASEVFYDAHVTARRDVFDQEIVQRSWQCQPGVDQTLNRQRERTFERPQDCTTDRRR